MKASDLSFTVRDNDSECETRYVIKIRERVNETTEKIIEYAKKLVRPEKCYYTDFLGLRFQYIYHKERVEYDVLVYPYGNENISTNKVYVTDYNGRYYTQLFDLIKSRYDLSEWFKDSDDQDYMIHRLVSHFLTSDIIKVLVNRRGELFGFMGVVTTDIDKKYTPTQLEAVDKESALSFCTDILLLQQIAKCFNKEYDSYCRIIVTTEDGYVRQLVDSVVQELHGRGYQSLAFWADLNRGTEVFEACGFDKDSMFFSRNLSNVKKDGNNGVRYILEI